MRFVQPITLVQHPAKYCREKEGIGEEERTAECSS